MTVEFTVAPGSLLGTAGAVALIVTGAVLVVASLSMRRSSRSTSGVVVMLIVGLVVIGLGGALGLAGNSPSTITIGDKYVFVQSPAFTGAGDTNVTSAQIASAYVGTIGSGNLTLAKQHGTNRGDVNIGVFTVNGASAVVVSDSSEVLVIHLVSGSYVILGTSDIGSLVLDFSSSVYPVPNALSTIQIGGGPG